MISPLVIYEKKSLAKTFLLVRVTLGPRGGSGLNGEGRRVHVYDAHAPLGRRGADDHGGGRKVELTP